MIYFACNLKPISYNSKNKTKYQKRLKDSFKVYEELYPKLPLTEDLVSRIVHIHKYTKNVIDVDNLSKPFIDAFSGTIYKDDIQIRHRECSRIHFDELVNIEINYSGMKEEIASALDQYIMKEESDILYFEIDKFDYSMVKVGNK